MLFARPALRRMQGAPAPPSAPARCSAAPVARQPKRDEAVRVRLDDGRALPTGPQGSHQLHSMLGADALAIVPRGEGDTAGRGRGRDRADLTGPGRRLRRGPDANCAERIDGVSAWEIAPTPSLLLPVSSCKGNSTHPATPDRRSGWPRARAWRYCMVSAPRGDGSVRVRRCAETRIWARAGLPAPHPVNSAEAGASASGARLSEEGSRPAALGVRQAARQVGHRGSFPNVAAAVPVLG